MHNWSPGRPGSDINWHDFGGNRDVCGIQVFRVLQLCCWLLASDSSVVLASSVSFSPLMLDHCAHHRLMSACPASEKPCFSYSAIWLLGQSQKKMPWFRLENSFQLDYLLPHNLATRIFKGVHVTCKLPNPCGGVLIWCELARRISKPPPIVSYCCCNYYHHPPTIGAGLSRLLWCWCGPLWRALRHCGPRVPTLGDGQ